MDESIIHKSMRKAFEGIVGEKTCDYWSDDLLKYDDKAVEVLTGHFAGTRRPMTHIIYYKDRQNNILTFLIPLT